MKPTITFLIGMPAVGKSTFIQEQGWDRDPHTLLHSTDNIIEAIAMSEGITYDDFFDADAPLPWPKKRFAKEVLPIAIGNLNHAIENDFDIVVDMVNNSAHSRGLTLQSIDPNQYNIEAIVFGHDRWAEQDPRFLRKIKKAVQKRSLEQNKTVPDNVLDRMFSGYEEPSRDEGFDRITYLEPLNPALS